MERMHPIHIISFLSPYGGTAQKYLTWVKNSSLKHIFVLYEGSRQEDRMSEKFCGLGAEIIALREKSLVDQISKISKLIKKYENPCLLGHYFRGAVLAAGVKIVSRVPLVIPLHSPAQLNSFPRNVVFRLAFEAADAIIYNSQFTAKSYGFSSRSRIVYNGSDYNVIPVKTGFMPSSKINLVAIGGLVKVKNYNIIIEMMRHLPNNFSLKIIGDGPARATLESLVEKYDLHSRVTLCGYINNAAQEMSSADIFLHPSIAESFGVVVAEALFARVPVIVTNRCATYEIVDGGMYGWVAHAHDPLSWAETVRMIVSNPDTAWSKAVKGREWAIMRFSDLGFSNTMDDIVAHL